MAVTTFLPVIGRHAVAISSGDSINEFRYACAPGTPVFAVLDGSVSFIDEGMAIKSLKGRLVVTYLGVDRAESGTRQSDVLAAGQFIGRVSGRASEAGLVLSANLGQDVHDIGTLLADADDPVVMWPRGAQHIVRPSDLQGLLPSAPPAAAAEPDRSTGQVESVRRRRQQKRSAPALRSDVSSPPDSAALEDEVTPEREVDELDDSVEPEAPAEPSVSDEPDEVEESGDHQTVAGHRLAARRTRPALRTRRRGG